jgi:hypothetical protein
MHVFASHPDDAGAVMVRLYPGTDLMVEMRLEAVIHLWRLVERYNWTQSVEARRSDRWRKFWPVISALERRMVVMFVRTNSHGEFGRMLDVPVLPPALEPYRGDRRVSPMSPSVECEFASLLHVFYRSIVSADEILPVWEAHLSGVSADRRSVLLGAFRKWLDEPPQAGVSLEAMLRDALKARGMSQDDAEQLALRLGGEVDGLIKDKTEVLYASMAQGGSNVPPTLH